MDDSMGGNDMSIKFKDRKNLVSLVEGAISCESFEDGTCKFLDKDENILPSPSSAVIQVRKDEIQAEIDSVAYAKDRTSSLVSAVSAYPSIGDQLDMLFHDMTAGKGTKDGEWYKAIEQVKADNPKP